MSLTVSAERFLGRHFLLFRKTFIAKNFLFVGCSIVSVILYVKKIMGTGCRGVNNDRFASDRGGVTFASPHKDAVCRGIQAHPCITSCFYDHQNVTTTCRHPLRIQDRRGHRYEDAAYER